MIKPELTVDGLVVTREGVGVSQVFSIDNLARQACDDIAERETLLHIAQSLMDGGRKIQAYLAEHDDGTPGGGNTPTGTSDA